MVSIMLHPYMVSFLGTFISVMAAPSIDGKHQCVMKIQKRL